VGGTKAVLAGYVTGFLCILTLEIYFYVIMAKSFEELIAIFITNLIIYTCLGFCYCNFLALGVTALRTRILLELKEAVGGLTIEECLQRYTPEEMLEKRKERWTAIGAIIYSNDRFYIGKHILLDIARVIDKLKLFLLGEKMCTVGELQSDQNFLHKGCNELINIENEPAASKDASETKRNKEGIN